MTLLRTHRLKRLRPKRTSRHPANLSGLGPGEVFSCPEGDRGSLSCMEIRIGRVVKSHGVRGEVVVEPLADDEDIHFAQGEVLHGRQAGKERDLTVTSVRPHQKRLLVTFEEVADRTAAESLRGMQFFAEPLERDEDSDEYYDHELIGLKVLLDHAGGTHIGDITGVMTMPNRKLLEVDYQGKEALIPFVMDIVPEIDLDEGYLVITPPEGLLEL